MAHLSDAAFQRKLEDFGYCMAQWIIELRMSENWDNAERYRVRANNLKKELIHAYVTVRTEDDKAA